MRDSIKLRCQLLPSSGRIDPYSWISHQYFFFFLKKGTPGILSRLCTSNERMTFDGKRDMNFRYLNFISFNDQRPRPSADQTAPTFIHPKERDHGDFLYSSEKERPRSPRWTQGVTSSYKSSIRGRVLQIHVRRRRWNCALSLRKSRNVQAEHFYENRKIRLTLYK